MAEPRQAVPLTAEEQTVVERLRQVQREGRGSLTVHVRRGRVVECRREVIESIEAGAASESEPYDN